jgi:hypothetical protein
LQLYLYLYNNILKIDESEEKMQLRSIRLFVCILYRLKV